MKTTSTSPLVSCIMPTYNRRQFVPNAIHYFFCQDYETKELIILDDGIDSVEDLIPNHADIRYIRLDKKITLGAKLNLGCTYAKGDIILHWDDDDWYAPWRLSYQMKAMEEEKIELCGINNLLYYDFSNKKGYQYKYPNNEKKWIAGSTQCYRKRLWEQIKFENINVGMDGLFSWATPEDNIKVLPNPKFSVFMIHPNNGSSKKTQGAWWSSYPIRQIETVMGADWKYYAFGNVQIIKENEQTSNLAGIKKKQYKQQAFQNIYACLVHEKEDCIIDLVRNLHYLDSDSKIILYNGSPQENLNEYRFDYTKYNAVWHPNPTPQEHGYLHGFALDCMEYALEHFSFDTFTIVDSDQLGVKPNYSNFIRDFLIDKPNVGMLSSNPLRVHPHDRNNYVALQAYKEYDLWKPLLDSFENGEHQFLHWTFWPSTVFTKPAIEDLLELFQKNSLLKKIMQDTKIWATEEVIFPTLVKLLGYDILKNPCSFDFVKYKIQFNSTELKLAIFTNNAYWIHPIDRVYDNPLRQFLRDYYKHYVPLKSGSPENDSKADVFSIVEKIKSIEGWLTDKEAYLLITTLFATLLKKNAAVVEVGSYHGKATIAIGTVLKEFFPTTKMLSIDPHNGQIGAVDQGLKEVPSSFEPLIENIQKFGLENIIQAEQGASHEVSWEEPIAVLLIDGLHDYPSVARDFFSFASFLELGGVVIFHDYVHYYPGVMAFVDELINEGIYMKKQQADTLIVLQKIKNKHQ